MWILAGARSRCRGSHGRDLASGLLERQHLPSRASRALVLGAPLRPGTADSAGLPPDGQHHPRLQPAVSHELLALRPWDVPAGPRSRSREIGDGPWVARAAFVAGLIYAFVPLSHRPDRAHPVAQLAVDAARALRLSPLHRARGHLRPLVGGTAALLMQNWSCGYYLIFFAPFVAAVRGAPDVDGRAPARWRCGRICRVRRPSVAARTWPFLALYLEAQRVHGFERPLGEVMSLLGRRLQLLHCAGCAPRCGATSMQAFPKPEGELFFGIVPIVLAVVALVAQWRSRACDESGDASAPPVSRIASQRHACSRHRDRRCNWRHSSLIVLTGGFVSSVAGIPDSRDERHAPSRRHRDRAAALLALPRSATTASDAWLRSPLTLAAALTLSCRWLSLGPCSTSRGQLLQLPPLYALLLRTRPWLRGPPRPGALRDGGGRVSLDAGRSGGRALMRRHARRRSPWSR